MDAVSYEIERLEADYVDTPSTVERHYIKHKLVELYAIQRQQRPEMSEMYDRNAATADATR